MNISFDVVNVSYSSDLDQNLVANTSILSNVSEAEASSPSPARWTVILYALLTTIAICGNLCVILLILVYRKLRTPFNYILLNIAVGDAMIGIFSMPQYASSYLYWGFWPFSDKQCSFWIFFDYFMPAVSLSSIAALSFDRLWAVTYPNAYRTCNTRRKALALIAITWLVSTVGVLPGYSYSRTYFSNQSANQSCSWDIDGLPDWATDFTPLVVNIWVPFAVTLACYIGTVLKLLKIRLKRQIIIPQHAEGRRGYYTYRVRQEKQAFRVVTFLVFAFFITYTPWTVYSVRMALLKYNDPAVFGDVASWMSYSLSAFSPFICGAGSRDMKNGLKELFGKRKVDRGEMGRSAVNTITS